ncbi:MAG: hypothetical protein K1X53_08425 [Candidatus Sumerlaeaceae bacterium]|nr:hypothetical protein [Candidatus Sumerlaeaceae bacterium]
MPDTLYQCMTKATTAEGEDIRFSQNWVTSRRGTLRVTTESLECGDWHIRYSDIREAVLFSTRQMFIPCYVLRIRTGSQIYQFGLNPGSYWKGELPFPVRRERMALRYSPFSIVVRLLLLAAVAYSIWKTGR